MQINSKQVLKEQIKGGNVFAEGDLQLAAEERRKEVWLKFDKNTFGIALGVSQGATIA